MEQQSCTLTVEKISSKVITVPRHIADVLSPDGKTVTVDGIRALLQRFVEAHMDIEYTKYFTIDQFVNNVIFNLELLSKGISTPVVPNFPNKHDFEQFYKSIGYGSADVSQSIVFPPPEFSWLGQQNKQQSRTCSLLKQPRFHVYYPHGIGCFDETMTKILVFSPVPSKSCWYGELVFEISLGDKYQNSSLGISILDVEAKCTRHDAQILCSQARALTIHDYQRTLRYFK